MCDEDDGLDSDQILKKNSKLGFRKAFRLKNFSKIKRSSFSFKREDIDKDNSSSADDHNSTEEASNDPSSPFSWKSSSDKLSKVNSLFNKDLFATKFTSSGGQDSSPVESTNKDTVASNIPQIVVEDFDRPTCKESYDRSTNDTGRFGDRRSIGRSLNPYRWGTYWTEAVSATPKSTIQTNQGGPTELPKTAKGSEEESVDSPAKYQENNPWSTQALQKKIPFPFPSMDRRRSSTTKEEANHFSNMVLEDSREQREQKKPGPIPMVMASIKRKNDPSVPKERLFKVLLIGDPGVGKTSFVQRYTTNLFRTDYKGTVGVDFALKLLKINNETMVKLQLWDVAGQERFTWMTRVYYRDARGCIIMFDLSNRNSFLNVSRWKKDLDKKCVTRDGKVVPCLLLANKCDLRERKVSIEEVEEFYKKHDFIGWTETSAKNDLMVRDSVKFLVDIMLKEDNDELIRFGLKNTFDEVTDDDEDHPTLRLNGDSFQAPRSLMCSPC